jgi:hypothetical protein
MLEHKPSAAILTCMLSLLSTATLAGSYRPPRTAEGMPDMQGVWSNASITALERMPAYHQLVLSTAEVAAATAAHPQVVRQRTDDNQSQRPLDGSDLRSGRGYNAFWIDPGMSFGRVRGEFRTSWIVHPADGRIPYTDAGRDWIAQLARKRESYDGPETRPLGERCLAVGGRVGPPMLNGLYNNNYQIVQTADYVVIHVEMISHARIIPLRGRRSVAGTPELFGESLGRWEGDTLVVETSNFHPLQAESAVHLTRDGKVTERFTRVSDEQILYEFVVEDPFFYQQPWRGELSFNKSAQRLYEYACHEGNYAMVGVLAGAREQERVGH